MANFYFGLNANKNFSEVQDKIKSLANLGLDIEDLDKIRGISNVGVIAADIKSLANLQEDARRALGALRADANIWDDITRDFKTVRDIIKTNTVIEEGQLKAQAVKYTFYDYGTDTLKTADISTSRVSAWSQFPNTTEIFYGSDVEVVPAPAGDPNVGRSYIEFDHLFLKSAPTPKRFKAEVPTHTIDIEINGSIKKAYAMQGIPLVFNGFFKTVSTYVEIDETVSPSIPPTYLVRGVDEEDEDIREDQPLTSSLRFYDYRYREKDIELYYRPDGFKRIDIGYANLSEFPNTVLSNLQHLGIAFNDFREIPDFATLAPNLKKLYLNGNDLNRGTLNSAQQVLRLPSSLTHLNITGTFTDNQNLDLTHLTNLQYLYFSEYASRYIRRRIVSPISPAIAPSIIHYDVYNQGHSRLHTTVCDAPLLEDITIYWNNITRDNLDRPIVMKSALGSGETHTRGASDVVTGTGSLRYWRSASNSHNILSVKGNGGIVYYQHSYSRGLVSDAYNNNEFGDKFNGCNKLATISFYATDIRGNVGTAISALPAISWFDVRFSIMHGKLTGSSTVGSESLRSFLVAGGYFGRESVGGAEIPYTQKTIQVETPPGSGIFEDQLVDTDYQFFDETSGRIFERCAGFQDLYAYSTRSIKGTLPDLSRNYSTRVVYVPYTNLNTGLEYLTALPSMYYLNIDNCKFTSMPKFTSNALTYFYAQTNLFSGILPEFDTPSLRYFYAYNNSFSGAIPNFGQCTRLERLLLNNNSFEGYTPGALSINTRLNRLDLSNNNLTRSSIVTLIDDLEANYNANTRSGVAVILTGNGVTAGDLPEATVTKISNLINNGWSVSI